MIKHFLKEKIKAMKVKFFLKNNKMAKKVPPLKKEDYLQIDQELYDIIPLNNIEHYLIREDEFKKFEENLGFQSYYQKKYWTRYYRKIAEYYLTYNLLKLNRNESYIYVDGAGSSSPWTSWLAKRTGADAYIVDIADNVNHYDKYIQSDIRHTTFNNNSVDVISFQSAIETFPENIDIECLHEAYRILKPGGMMSITPVYLHKTYINCYGISYYNNGVEPNDEAVRFIRTDFDMPFTRLYDVNHLKERIIDEAIKLGFNYKLFIVSKEKDEDKLYSIKHSFIYLRYFLLFIKE